MAETFGELGIRRQSFHGLGEASWVARWHQQGVDTVLEDLGNPTNITGHYGHSDARGLHQCDRKAFVERGQDKPIGAGQERQHVVPLAQELEPIAESQVVMPGAQGGLERSVSYGGDTDGKPAIGKKPSRLEQHVVSLLGTKVGHRQEEKLVLHHSELRSNERPLLVPPRQKGIRLGQIDAMHHCRGTVPQRRWKGLEGCL